MHAEPSRRCPKLFHQTDSEDAQCPPGTPIHKPDRAPTSEEIDRKIWKSLKRASEWPLDDADEEYRQWVLSGITEARAFRLVIEFVLEQRRSGRLPEHFKVLDVGTSFGVVPLTLQSYGAESYASDVQDRFGPYLEREGVNFVQHDLSKGELPYDDGTFDVIVLKDSIEHFGFSPKTTLAGIHRILKPSGFFILSCPNISRISARVRSLAGRSIHQPLNEWFESDYPFLGHYREYTLKELVTMLKWENFDIVRTRQVQMQDIPVLVRERSYAEEFPTHRRSLPNALVLGAWELVARVVPSFAQHNFVVSRAAPSQTP